MSDFPSRLPARPSLEQLHKQAKELLRRHRAAGSRSIVTLADAQFALAREYGFESWAKLKQHIESRRNPADYEKLAQDLMRACHGDADALQRVNNIFGSAFTRFGNPFTAEQLREKMGGGEIALSDARLFIARYGLESSAPALFRIDSKENTIAPGPLLSDKDWDAVFAVMKERQITGLDAGGRMTDATLERLCELKHVTHLNLGGSVQLSDSGLAHLARLPLLRELDLSGSKGRITDDGLRVLRHLPRLRRFQMCWQQNVSDTGLANLAFCDDLESVDLLGTQTGDGAVQALTGKRKLRRFKTGRCVTDAGLALFQRFPVFKTWHGGDIDYGLMSADAGPTHLVVDGPFTDAGLANLAGLDGLFALSFFWHSPAFTAEGLEALKDLAHLGFLGCEGEHCTDEAMRRIGAMPRLRMLMAQGAVAGDAGFAALSRSQTVEYIWGRECPNLTGRGFAALAAMPALRGLGVSCKNVDDAALSTLARFPALRELMPMDVRDEGFRHVGQCERLERFVVYVLPGHGGHCHRTHRRTFPPQVLLRRQNRDHRP